jgi:hypothetical protein
VTVHFVGFQAEETSQRLVGPDHPKVPIKDDDTHGGLGQDVVEDGDFFGSRCSHFIDLAGHVLDAAGQIGDFAQDRQGTGVGGAQSPVERSAA